MLRTVGEDEAALAIGGYIRRAREERALAIRAPTSEAAYAHMALARRYEALVTLAEQDEGNPSAAQCEIAYYAMSTQKIFPFYRAQALRL